MTSRRYSTCPRRSRNMASTRCGSATACSRSRATSRSRSCQRSLSAPNACGSAPPASSPRSATRSSLRWSGPRSTCSPAAARSSAPAWAARTRACAATELERDWSDYTVSYQVTMNIGDSEEEARSDFDDYISKYYPELSLAMDLSNWGPVGTPETIAEWMREFHRRGVDYFICRFGAIDQFGQVERFAKEILPMFESERVR